MTEPDYKIEEIFDPGTMKVHFIVYKGTSPFAIQFYDLEKAKECVRMLRKYKNRVFHYVED